MAPLQPHASSRELGYGDDVEMIDHPPKQPHARASLDIGGAKETLAVIADVNSQDSLQEADESNTDAALKVSKSTPADAAGMKRMGKQQQLVRHFRLVSTVSFVALCTAAWEIGLFVITPALTNGGRAGLVWNVLWNIIGFGPIYLSMAEMASMAPIAGAQYHWVSEFAPESMQRVLSYISGYVRPQICHRQI